MPWDNYYINNKDLYTEKVFEEKKNIYNFIINNNIPFGFACMIKYIRNVNYDEIINYHYIDMLLDIIIV